MSAPFDIYDTSDNPHVYSDGDFPPQDEIPSHVIVQRSVPRCPSLGPNERPHFYTHPSTQSGYFGPADASNLESIYGLMYRPVGHNKYELVTMPDDVFPPFEKICVVNKVQRIWLTSMSLNEFSAWVVAHPESFIEQRRFFINKTDGGISASIHWLGKCNVPNRMFANILMQCDDVTDKDERIRWANAICLELYRQGFHHSQVEWAIHPDFDIRRPDLKQTIEVA